MARKTPRRKANSPDSTVTAASMVKQPDRSSPAALLALPLLFALALGALGFLPNFDEQRVVRWSMVGAALFLVLWDVSLFATGRHRRPIALHFVLRRPHWLQPIVQACIYIYWGLHWGEVRGAVPLLLAQLLFAYGFDLLVVWSRRESQEIGFGPFPIILSMNLFLWFKPDWFYMQFVMVALAFAAKEFIRWERDGRSTHIFNPSAFPLAILSIGLIATGTADITWGNDIAVTLERPRYIFEFLFLLSIPAQVLFGVASMTLPAVATAFGLSAAYFGVTGVYFYFGPVPIAVFLGMLLLFTDPSTAPRTELGRVLYGVAYGASAFVTYGVLDHFGQKTFYDKLLFVPVLNLSAQLFDRIADSATFAWFRSHRLLPGLVGRRRNLAWAAAWAVVFLGVRAAHGVGDLHPANHLPFWQKACTEGRRNGCHNLRIMETTFCEKGSAWACNELGILSTEKHFEDAELPASAFERACQLGSSAGCENAKAPGGTLRHDRPGRIDIGMMVEAKALPPDPQPLDLMQIGCDEGWSYCCLLLAGAYRSGDHVAQDISRAKLYLDKACSLGEADGCSPVGLN